MTQLTLIRKTDEERIDEFRVREIDDLVRLREVTWLGDKLDILV